MSVSVATWNVNSVRSRLSHLLQWLREDAPDVVLLQELKCQDEQFPRMEVEDAGYNIITHGQKTYNGVAILSKFPLEDVTRGLPTFAEDSNARYIEAVISVDSKRWTGDKNIPLSAVHRPPSTLLRIASVYVPNGQEVGSDKYAYKLRFLEHLAAHLRSLRSYDEMLVVGGDYNIAPSDTDVANPKAWAGSVLTCDEVRTAFRRLLNAGLYDAALIPSAQSLPPQFTWWDYRAGAFAKNDGLRIDHLLLSPQAIDRLHECKVNSIVRGWEKPSDHAPVTILLR